MYQIHVPVWYRCVLVHPISPFFSRTYTRIAYEHSNVYDFLRFVSGVLVGSCGSSKHSLLAVIKLVGTLTANVSPYLWVYA